MSVSKRMYGWLLCGVTVVSLTACPKAEYPHCETDSDCSAKSQWCVAAKCVPCKMDQHCVAALGTGYLCKSSVCVPDGVERCNASTACTSGKECADTRCVAAAKPLTKEGGPCRDDTDCDSTLACIDSRCAVRPLDVVNATAPFMCVSSEHPTGLALSAVAFEVDRSELTVEAQQALEKNAECLRSAPRTILVEGHCDERGTTEYNMTLGEQRAASVAKYLERLGIAKDKLIVVSKGKSQPVCDQATEDCHAKNRRVEFH